MNNFETLKTTYKKETGLSWDANIQAYIAYYNAKIMETFLQAYCQVNKIQAG